MKCLLFALCFIPALSRAQVNPLAADVAVYGVSVPATAPANAAFPGGSAALDQFIADKLRYPEAAQLSGIDASCELIFSVQADGSISHIGVKRGIPYCPECDAEAIRVVQQMPKWKPGMSDGKPVASTYYLSVPFKYTPKR